MNKVNFGTFTGVVQNQTEILEFQFTDKDGKTITNQDFVGKYTVLDFWNTGCGVCFRKFPKFEEQYIKYRSCHQVALFSVNVKLPYDKRGKSFEIITDIGYSFPVLQFGQVEDAKNIFGIQVYPTIIVLNPAGIVVYRGNMEGAFLLVERELKNSRL